MGIRNENTMLGRRGGMGCRHAMHEDDVHVDSDDERGER